MGFQCVSKAMPKVINSQASAQPFLLAHQTKISGDVGGTHHIEPNDTPRAGETVTAWFALVKAGGQSIALVDCNCQVAVYATPYQDGDEAIAMPSLTAIDVEGQTNVPAADIIFPTVGAYELVISGSAQGDASFAPFELRFPITVAAGTKAETKLDVDSTQSSPSNPDTPSKPDTPTTSTQTTVSADPRGTGESPVNVNGGTFSVAIVGGIFVGVLLLGAIAFLLRRNHRPS